MTLKIPPPPLLTGPEWQAFNRWLLELQSILSDQGGIDPSEVAGLPAALEQITTNTNNIATLQSGQSGQSGQISGLQTQINNINTLIATINGQITSLSARNQVYNGTGAPNTGLGIIGDWYANIGGAVGARIYVKTGSATWYAFPF